MMNQIKVLGLLVVLALSVSGSSLGNKGGLEPQQQQQPAATRLEAPASKGRTLERQAAEGDEAPKPEKVRLEESKVGLRKPEAGRKEPSGDFLAQHNNKEINEAQQKPIEQLRTDKESSKTSQRYEARPQIIEQQQQLNLNDQEQVKLQQEPQTTDRQQEQIELRLPSEEQRKLPFEPAHQQAIADEELEQQQIRVAEAEPYSFSYAIDGSSRSESGDTRGVVRGQYTLQGADGSRRIVDYIADHDGFRASINTNEFGTENRSPAAVALRSSQPSAEDISLRLADGKTSQLQQQQQVIEQLNDRDVVLAVKGGPALVAPPAPVKTQQQFLPVLQEPKPIPAAVKRVEPARKEQIKLEEAEKSAEQLVRRESKSLKSPEGTRKELQSLVRSSLGFESATAHREYLRQPVLRREPLPLSSHHQPSPTTINQQQRHQYPLASPAAVGAGHRRHLQQVAEVRNPRVSFYSSSLSSTSELDNEQPSGFDSRSSA